MEQFGAGRALERDDIQVLRLARRVRLRERGEAARKRLAGETRK